ncbi:MULTISPECIES: biotin transporter BioY [Paenibacillus]|uniref:Biotin transporter n=1 Tax=Paenibacillus woosongensis TaxID=307580 RepID=A0A7X2Z5A4_9BACL|nr:biotin transporter BioY [Paenibacillus woosongensis]MUG47784.1 biotin transporter BioY [Paenibacillus woosongensis]GIP59462.1 biotin transporter BioY [Paenibacillus woosongensis]
MKIKDMMYVALFAAVMAVLGLLPPIPLPFIPVPITVQTLGVMLAGSILGARLGGLSLLIFAIIVLAGAPLLSGGRGGLSVLASPTGGYFLSWPIAAFLIGYMVQRMGARINLWKLILINVVGGILIIYAVGIPYMSFMTDVPLGKAIIGNITFIPGDLLKVVVSSLIAIRMLKVSPVMLRQANSRSHKA